MSISVLCKVGLAGVYDASPLSTAVDLFVGMTLATVVHDSKINWLEVSYVLY